MKQIDDQAYKDGATAFAKGQTIRQMTEKMISAKKDDGPDKDWRKAEDQFESFVLGFADALLTKLRTR